jgi:hypothetical protein
MGQIIQYSENHYHQVTNHKVDRFQA